MARAERIASTAPLEPAVAPPSVSCRSCGEPTGFVDASKYWECWWCLLERKQADAGFLREHQGATLADFPATVANQALEFIRNRDSIRGLFVCGPAGTGKTRLLSAILAAFPTRRATEYVAYGPNDYHDPVFGLARALIRGTWNPETQDAEIRRLSRVPLLVLDDLGREGRPTEAVLATLHEVISTRNGNYLPTAATSNYTLEQLGDRYDAAIADRLRPWGLVVMAGKSRR